MGTAKFFMLLLLSGWYMQPSLAVRAASLTSDPTPSRASISQSVEPAVRHVPCSIGEFPYFFRVFVRGLDDIMPRSAVRKAHVWPQVQVRSYQNPARLLATVPQQKYDSFKIGLLYNLWVYLDPKISTIYSESYPRLAIEFKTLNPQKIRVEYRQAEYVPAPNTGGNQERLVRTFGKPEAYIFEHSKGCWHLTQELRSAETYP
jgi:hypothetical protein